MKKQAFSLVELMVTLIIISCIISTLTPMITKKLKSQGITVGSGGGGTSSGSVEFSSDCSAWPGCSLCYEDKCILCPLNCQADEYTDTPNCKCVNCSTYNSNCQECDPSQCLKCDTTQYPSGANCTACPVKYYCDGTTKTICEEGTYQDEIGKTSCKTCEIGYKCTGGEKIACEAGYYSSTTNASSCESCPEGYYCEGAKDKIQCSGNQYQNETTKSSCKACAEGYYVSDDKTSCTICEAGYYCPGDGTKTQCPAGTYSQAGAKECIKCSAGTYSSTVGATSISTCQNCSAGKYSSTAGSASCSKCSAGYTSTTGSSTCSVCSAGTYNTTAGSSSCATCPKGYYCTGGTNKTSCGTGKYLDTTGNDSSSDCKTCSSKTANCSTCNLTTGVCTACASGYDLVDGVCDDGCPSLAMKVTLDDVDYCITKFNIGDHDDLPLPSTVVAVTANVVNCAPTTSQFCCWQGDTSSTQYCNANNGGYSGCTRTVCDWRAANSICSKLTYDNRSWFLPSYEQLTALKNLGADAVSNSLGTAGLQLCADNLNSDTTARCNTQAYCKGATNNWCYIREIWGADYSASEEKAYSLYLNTNDFGGPTTSSYSYAHSVRCWSYL